MANCAECKAAREQPVVPYVVHESAMARAERSQKRLWVVIILLILLLVGSNMAWIWYESQFETVSTTTTVEQDNESGFNNYVGNDGDIYNGETEGN